jgi:hypothetical protein
VNKWERRERKLRKRRSLQMVVSNRSLKSVLLTVIVKKGKKGK